MRKPINVLVIPFVFNKYNVIEYAVFKRADGHIFQFIAGGVEGNESVKEAAIRECYEEVGIIANKVFIELDSTASIPVTFFNHDKIWHDDVYVVKEISFGLEVKDRLFMLSDEHKSYSWHSYNEAYKQLTFDSNKVALWELNERLKSRS